MRRPPFVFFVILLSTTSQLAAEDGDPTFGHRFSVLHCEAAIVTACSESYCADLIDKKDLTYWISLDSRSIGSDPSRGVEAGQQIRFTELSEVGENRILFEKFEFTFKGALKRGMLVYLPLAVGYDVRLAIDTLVSPATTTALSRNLNGLRIDRWIESGRCEPSNRS